jgi:hypothetical protein
VGQIKSACTKMYSVVKRIDSMELTGGQTAEDLWRCALAVYNEGSSMMSHLYDISNNPKYKVGPEFQFRTSYDHFAKRTTILDCGGTNELRLEKGNDDVINDQRRLPSQSKVVLRVGCRMRCIAAQGTRKGGIYVLDNIGSEVASCEGASLRGGQMA